MRNQKRKRLWALLLSAAMIVTQQIYPVRAENGVPEKAITATSSNADEKKPLIKNITGWEFIDDDFLTGGELALPGVSADNQADFDAVVSMLPTQISAEIVNESSVENGGKVNLEAGGGYSEILDITRWSCPDYKRSGGHWPLTGEYVFTAELPNGYACDLLPKVKVVLGGISVMTINDRYTVDGLVYKEITPEAVQLIGLENDSFNKKLIVPAEITAGEKTFEVTGIGNEAFYGTDITGLDLSGANNLLYIGDSAFFGCSSLRGTLTIPESVTKIGDFAFGNNRNITGLDLSTAKNLEYIGNSAFTMCSSLKGKVWIPESVTEIGDNSFSSCGITGLDLSTAKNLQRIEFSAFARCYSLTGTVLIPESVTEIGDKAFLNCAITDLDLRKAVNLQHIGDMAFKGCEALTGSVFIPESVEEIGKNAFGGCKISKYTAANNVTAGLIKDSGVDKNLIKLPDGSDPDFPTASVRETFIVDDLEYAVTGTDTVALTGYAGTSPVTGVSVPAVVQNGDLSYQVTEIGNDAFSLDSKITELDLSGAKNLQRIGKAAFHKCSGLGGTVTIPGSMIEIGDFSFAETGITELELDGAQNLQYIGNYAFQKCNALKETVTIPKAVTQIGRLAFDKSGVTDVVIMGELHELGNKAFPANIPIRCIDPVTQKLVNEVLMLDQIPTIFWDGRSDVPAGAVMEAQGDVSVSGEVKIEPNGLLTMDPDSVITIHDGGIMTISPGAKVDGTGTIVVEKGGQLAGRPESGASVVYTCYVTVINGSGDGNFVKGDRVTISAATPAGKVFAGWTADGEDIIFEDPESADTTFVMPDRNVEVTANFMDPAPAIDIQPRDTTITIGDMATFTVTTKPSVSAAFQWQVNSGSGWTDVTDGIGGDTGSYTTPAVSGKMNGWSYRCVISNRAGSVTTGAAVLTVENKKISKIAVAGIVPPVAGAVPDTSAAADGVAGFAVGRLVWKSGDVEVKGNFDYDTVYTVYVTITAMQDYQFAETAAGTINGRDAVIGDRNGADITLAYTFDRTGAKPLYSVTVNGGTASPLSAAAGEPVTISAKVPDNSQFSGWQITPDVIFTEGNKDTPTAKFIMPAQAVTATADFREILPVPVAVTGVELDEKALSIYVNQTVTLTATVQPDNATDKMVSWDSSNIKTATVDGGGKVTAHAPGTTVITVTTKDGRKTAACTVTVQNKPDSGNSGSSDNGSSEDEGSDSRINPNILRGTWVSIDGGWMFRQTDGSYVKNRWGLADGLWYYFDGEGWMLTGWQSIGGRWYYLCTTETAGVNPGMKEGAMLTGWYFDLIYQKWFYFDATGAMATGWREIDGKWYYFNPISDGTLGAMVTDRRIDGWYVDFTGVWVE